MPELWTPDDTARFLRITPDQLSKLRQSGDGPPFTKVGRSVRYIPGEVASWVKGNARTSTKEEAGV